MIKILYPLLPDSFFFLHIPKCAGTSLIDLLDSMYVKDEIYPNHYNIPLLRQTPPAKIQTYRFFRGHLPVSILSSKLGFTPVMITVLRDPVTRLISNFEMRQRVPDPLRGLQSQLQQLTLEEFLDHPLYRVEFAHRATRLFGQPAVGRHSEKPNLDRALQVLHTCSVVGTTERFSDFLSLLAWEFKWPPIRYSRRKNVSPNREKRAEISDSVKERIRELEWADGRLYDNGRTRFEQAWERMQLEINSAGSNAWQERVLMPHIDNGKASQAESYFYDFSRVFPGQGWYAAERHPKYGLVRWSGPEERSYLYFYTSSFQDLTMSFRVVNWVKKASIKNLQVFINGKPARIHKSVQDSDGVIFHVLINKSLLSDAPLQEISLSIPKTYVPSRKEGRALGLCYQWMLLHAR